MRNDVSKISASGASMEAQITNLSNSDSLSANKSQVGNVNNDSLCDGVFEDDP